MRYSAIPSGTELLLSRAELNSSLSVFTLGSDAEEGMTAWGNKAFTNEEIALFKTIGGKSKLYAYGTVNYEDIFVKTRYTNFCFCVDFHQDEKGVTMLRLDQHSDSS